MLTGWSDTSTKTFRSSQRALSWTTLAAIHHSDGVWLWVVERLGSGRSATEHDAQQAAEALLRSNLLESLAELDGGSAAQHAVLTEQQ